MLASTLSCRQAAQLSGKVGRTCNELVGAAAAAVNSAAATGLPDDLKAQLSESGHQVADQAG